MTRYRSQNQEKKTPSVHHDALCIHRPLYPPASPPSQLPRHVQLPLLDLLNIDPHLFHSFVPMRLLSIMQRRARRQHRAAPGITRGLVIAI
jgi:hypothetical protein